MEASKAIKLLKLLDEEELKRLLKFLKSPFYNANPRIIKLYEYLRKYHPDYSSPKLKKEKVFAKLFPDRVFDYSKFSNLLSDFSQLLEEYLIVIESKKDDFQRQQLLNKSFGRRNAHALFDKKTHQLLAQLEEQPYRDIEYYERSKSLLHDYYFHIQTKKDGAAKDYPIKTMEQLDKQFLLEKWRLSVELLSRKTIYSLDYDMEWLFESLLKNKKLPKEKVSLFILYSNLVRLLKDGKFNDFFLVKELFKEGYLGFSKDDQFFIFQQLLNYSIKQINKGERDFYGETFDLYKLGIEMNVLFDNGEITERTFYNIITLSSSLKEFYWTTNFIETYQHYLKEEIRSSVRILSYAILNFEKKEFNRTIHLLNTYPFKNALQELKARSITIRSWYELYLKDQDNYELLIAQIEAFEKFLIRNQLIAARRVSLYQNFLKMLRRITNYHLQFRTTQSDKDKLFQILENYQAIMLKNWLKDRIEKLN